MNKNTLIVEQKNLIRVIIGIMSVNFILLFILTDIIIALIMFLLEKKKTPFAEILIHTYNHLLNFDNFRIYDYSTKLVDIFHYLFSYVVFIFFTALLVDQLLLLDKHCKDKKKKKDFILEMIFKYIVD